MMGQGDVDKHIVIGYIVHLLVCVRVRASEPSPVYRTPTIEA